MASGLAFAQLALAAASAAEQKRASDKQASAQKDQSALASIESEAEAKRVEKINKRNEDIQAMQFLKSGVRLEGTPLSVLAETESDNTAFEKSIRFSGSARSRLLSKKADATSRGGTASAIGTGAQAAGNFAKFQSKQPSSFSGVSASDRVVT